MQTEGLVWTSLLSPKAACILRKHRSFAEAGFPYVRRVSQKAKMVEIVRSMQDLPTSTSQTYVCIAITRRAC